MKKTGIIKRIFSKKAREKHKEKKELKKEILNRNKKNKAFVKKSLANAKNLDKLIQNNYQLKTARHSLTKNSTLQINELLKHEKVLAEQIKKVFEKYGLNGIKALERDWETYKKKYQQQLFEKAIIGLPESKKIDKKFLEKLKQQIDTYSEHRMKTSLKEAQKIFKQP